MAHTFGLCISLLFSHLQVVGMLALCLVVNATTNLNGVEKVAGDAFVASPSTDVAAANIPKSAAPATPTLDLRDALAISARERNSLNEQVTHLEKQKWLLISIAVLMSGVAIWLGMLILHRGLVPAKQAVAKPGQSDQDSDIFSADDETGKITSVTKRKNATITIRNSKTQKEEISERVETRRFFSKDDDSKVLKRKATASVEHKTTKIQSPQQPVLETELRPSTDRTEKIAKPAEALQTATTTHQRPKTVRVVHQSDRLESVDVGLKPGTGPIIRQGGFSILEVMISLAILTTVLASVISSVYTLHYSRIMAKERTVADEICRMFIERIMAAPASSLASGNNDSLFRPRFVDFENIPGRTQPLTQQMIKNQLENFNGINTYLLANNQDGVNAALELNELKVFVEYYRIENLIYALQNDKPLDLNDNGYDDTYFDTVTNTITPKRYSDLGFNNNLDDRVEWGEGAYAIRIVVKWKGVTGIKETREQIFARGL